MGYVREQTGVDVNPFNASIGGTSVSDLIHNPILNPVGAIGSLPGQSLGLSYEDQLSIGGAIGTGAYLSGAGAGVGTTAGTTGTTGLLGGTTAGISNASLLGGGLSLAGGYLQGKSAEDAARAQADATLEAARLGAEQAAFRPVGMTTGFGTSQFQMGPDGRLQSAGYQLTPEMQAQFGTLQGMAGQNLSQYQQGQANAQPLMDSSQRMFGLGQGYLQQDPQAQAAQYMAQQQALLAPQNEQALAGIRQNLYNTGRSGLAMGATEAGGMQATNPEMAAYYNSLAQQNSQIAANAQAEGRANAQFGAGMMGTGASTLGNYYSAQNAALSPYSTALGAAQGIDTSGQQALEIGRVLGAGNQNSGSILAQGGANAATARLPADSYNPFATLAMAGGQMLSNYQAAPQQAQPAQPYSTSMFDYGTGGYPMGNTRTY